MFVFVTYRPERSGSCTKRSQE